MTPRSADPPDRPRNPALAASSPASAGQWIRVVGNAINLSTAFGLAVGAVGGARFRLGPRGLILAEHYGLRFPIAGAFTIGDVCLTAADWETLLERMPALLDHEERHSWQYLGCLGLPFVTLYAAAMGWSWLRTGDRAARNVFERSAGLTAGGYADRPARSLADGVRALVAVVRPGSAS